MESTDQKSSKIAVILLAGGSSERFGSNKFTALINNELLIEMTLRPFIKHKELQTDIIVVTGKYTDQLTPILEKYNIQHVHNPSFNLGMSTSIMQAFNLIKNILEKYSAILIHPADIPLIKELDLDLICEAHRIYPMKIIIPKFENTRGHPILIPNCFFIELEKISEVSQGLRGLMNRTSSEIHYVSTQNQGVLLDIDTSDDIDHILKLMRSK